MADIKSLLHTNVSEYKEPPKWPAGNYRLSISSYTLGTNKNSGALGVAFACRALSSVEAEDEGNPELAEDMVRQLEAYGDWAAKAHSWTWEDKETKAVHLMGYCPLNFLLQTPDGDQHAAASFFYLRDAQTQEESGFVHDVLGLTVPEGTELGDVLDLCVGREFYGMFEWVVNPKKPDSPPNLQLSSVSSV